MTTRADQILSEIVQDLRRYAVGWSDIDVDDRNALISKWRTELRADREAAPAPLVQALLTALKRVTEHMDRAGGDGYGMPECPWCRCQFGDRSDDRADHQPDCELVLARQVMADVEAGIGAARPGVASPQSDESRSPDGDGQRMSNALGDGHDESPCPPDVYPPTGRTGRPSAQAGSPGVVSASQGDAGLHGDDSKEPAAGSEPADSHSSRPGVAVAPKEPTP